MYRVADGGRMVYLSASGGSRWWEIINRAQRVHRLKGDNIGVTK
jgi:hypothetical protein